MKVVLIVILAMLLSFSTAYACGAPEGGCKHVEGAQAMNMEKEDLGICLVMGGKARKDIFYAYEGKTYYFCCPMCIREFKKDPGKYISAA